jgi:hypothetical protein
MKFTPIEERLLEREKQLRSVLAGIRKIRDEITNSDTNVPRWVPIDLNKLVLQFADEKGTLHE